VTVEIDDIAMPESSGTSDMGGLLRNSSLYLLGNLASKAVGFVMIPFYAHYLTVEEYGTLSLLELATTIIAMGFGLQSVGQALTRIYHDQTDGAGRDQAVSTALIGTAVAAGLVALGAALAASPIARAVGLAGQTSLLRLAFGGMFFSSVCEVMLVYQRMRDRARFYLAYSLITLVATLSLNIALIAGWRLGVMGFVLSKLVVMGIGCLYLLWRCFGEVGVAWRGKLGAALARFAAPLIVSGGSYLAIHFSDRLFLARVSRADVGVYTFAYNFAFLLSVLIGDSFSKSWSVSFYGLASGEGWHLRFIQVGRWLIAVMGAGAVGISLFGRDTLVLLVPPSYYPPLLLLPVLTFGYFLREVGDFFNSMLLIGIGSGLVGRIALAGAVLNLALNAMLIPYLGIWGAAWATFATWAAYCAASWLFAWRLHGAVMPPWPLCQMLGVSLLCLLARAALAPGGAVARLALDVAVFVVFVLVVWIGYLRGAERREAWGMARVGVGKVRKALLF
jgi:O-antigen/teichoic acid export membrane protein